MIIIFPAWKIYCLPSWTGNGAETVCRMERWDEVSPIIIILEKYIAGIFKYFCNFIIFNYFFFLYTYILYDKYVGVYVYMHEAMYLRV